MVEILTKKMMVITYLEELVWVCKWFRVKSMTLLSVCCREVKNFFSVNVYKIILWKIDLQ